MICINEPVIEINQCILDLVNTLLGINMTGGLIRIHLLDYIKINKVIDIYAYLGSRKSCVSKEIIKLILACSKGVKNSGINGLLTKFSSDDAVYFIIEGSAGRKDKLANIILYSPGLIPSVYILGDTANDTVDLNALSCIISL